MDSSPKTTRLRFLRMHSVEVIQAYPACGLVPSSRRIIETAVSGEAVPSAAPARVFQRSRRIGRRV